MAVLFFCSHLLIPIMTIASRFTPVSQATGGASFFALSMTQLGLLTFRFRIRASSAGPGFSIEARRPSGTAIPLIL